MKGLSKVVIVLVQGLQDPLIFPKSKTDTFSPGARSAFKSWFFIIFRFFRFSGFRVFEIPRGFGGQVMSLCIVSLFLSNTQVFFQLQRFSYS